MTEELLKIVAEKQGKVLRDRREELDITQIELGLKIGVTNKTIQNIEKGKWPNGRTLVLLHWALDMPLI